MQSRLRNLKRNIRQFNNMLFPISCFIKKWETRKRCLFNGKGSVLKNTIFEGHNMIGRQVTLVNCAIGEGSYINHNSRLIGSKIGRYCSIADNVYSGFGHHPLECISTHSSFFYDTSSQLGWSLFANNTAPTYDPYKHPQNESKFITVIGHDVWIGSHVMLMDGITIGTGAVIGTGSVVTKDVPPYAIVAGTPAKIIRYRHSESTIKHLLESQWWNLSFEDLKSNFQNLNIKGVPFCL